MSENGEQVKHDRPRERLVVAAAGYGHLYGPNVSTWPEFALREVNGWLGLIVDEGEDGDG